MSDRDKNLTDDVKRSEQLLALSDAQIALIINLLIEEEDRVDEVKKRFRECEGKNLSLEVIQDIRLGYLNQIKEAIHKNKNDISKIPLANEYRQLKYLQRLMKHALDDTITRRHQKVGRDDYEEVQGIDAKLAVEIVDKAHKITADIEQRKLEREKIELRKVLGSGRGAPGANDPDGEFDEGEDDEDDVEYA